MAGPRRQVGCPRGRPFRSQLLHGVGCDNSHLRRRHRSGRLHEAGLRRRGSRRFRVGERYATCGRCTRRPHRCVRTRGHHLPQRTHPLLPRRHPRRERRQRRCAHGEHRQHRELRARRRPARISRRLGRPRGRPRHERPARTGSGGPQLFRLGEALVVGQDVRHAGLPGVRRSRVAHRRWFDRRHPGGRTQRPCRDRHRRDHHPQRCRRDRPHRIHVVERWPHCFRHVRREAGRRRHHRRCAAAHVGAHSLGCRHPEEVPVHRSPHLRRHRTRRSRGRVERLRNDGHHHRHGGNGHAQGVGLPQRLGPQLALVRHLTRARRRPRSPCRRLDPLRG